MCVRLSEDESRRVLNEEISNPGERVKNLAKLLSRFPILTPVESAIAEDAGTPPVIVYRIRINKITGVGKQ